MEHKKKNKVKNRVDIMLRKFYTIQTYANYICLLRKKYEKKGKYLRETFNNSYMRI
jgi:hypothetical protein